MKNNLKKITDKTINALLQNEIILPSSYFKSFDQNAKDFSVEIQDSDFENEIGTVIVEELNSINNYMNATVKNIDALSIATDDIQQAIKEKDEYKIQMLNASISNMKKEIIALKDSIYRDPLTHSFTRRWIYNNVVSSEGTFVDEGVLVFIDLIDCDYLTDKYGNLLTDNVILYIAKFLTNKFEAEKIDCNIARYTNSQFVLFIKDEEVKSIISFIKNLRMQLAHKTLKSKSGLMFKTNFTFGLAQYNSFETFQDVIEKAAALSFKENENVHQEQ